MTGSTQEHFHFDINIQQVKLVWISFYFVRGNLRGSYHLNLYASKIPFRQDMICWQKEKALKF